jgi:hypothetical protein
MLIVRIIGKLISLSLTPEVAMDLKIPFSPDVAEFIKNQFADGSNPQFVALVLALAERFDEEPDSIFQRIAALTKEVKRVVYNLP